jgi:deazaflavin-dependent oxidoreductase (nitroreductase family)
MLVQLAGVAGALFVGLVAIALVFLLGMRAKSTLVLNPLIRLQRTILNPRQMRSAGTPGAYASVIGHRGRVSGQLYETPVGVVADGDGFLIALVYGSRTQWLRNVLAAGSVTIVHEGRTYAVDQPEVIPMQTVAARFTSGDQQGFRVLRVDQALRVRKVEPEEAGAQVTDAPAGLAAPDELRTVVRDLRPEDREAAIQVLAASFQGFGPADQVVGFDDKAPDRRRRMFEMTIKKGAKQNVIVAERDGRIEGVLTYADRPDCIPSARESLAAVRIAGPRLPALIRDFRMVGKAHPRAPHRHLPVLGVHPEAQGLGIGGLLMSEYARRCDEAGLEGYLETTRWADPSKRAQERLYERHGFVVAEVVPMTDDWSGAESGLGSQPQEGPGPVVR